MTFLKEMPVTTIWGVGKAFAATLEKDGIRTVGQLQTMDEGKLMRRYGSIGQRLFHLSRGQDTRQVHIRDSAKSISSETTFNSDHSDRETLVPVLRSLSEKVAHRLKKSGTAGHTIALKLKGADFKSKTRNKRLDDPTCLADRIFRTGLSLLERELDGTRYRLLGNRRFRPYQSRTGRSAGSGGHRCYKTCGCRTGHRQGSRPVRTRRGGNRLYIRQTQTCPAAARFRPGHTKKTASGLFSDPTVSEPYNPLSCGFQVRRAPARRLRGRRSG